MAKKISRTLGAFGLIVAALLSDTVLSPAQLAGLRGVVRGLWDGGNSQSLLQPSHLKQRWSG